MNDEQSAHPHYPSNIEVQGGVNENNIIEIIDEAAKTHSCVIMDLEGSANLPASHAMSRAGMLITLMSGTKLDSHEAAEVIAFIACEGKARRHHIPYRILSSKYSAIQMREERDIRKEMGEAKIPILAHGMVNKAAFSTFFGFGCTIYHLNKGDFQTLNLLLLMLNTLLQILCKS
ncbi:hypothetical protein H704_01056 [Bartonella bacilliformis Peru38]|uniref:Partition protein ParA n=1 Tax=Bartonella bacilliformis INS TaxID=1206782 RepID=A0ABN0IF48_BARBA|nr:hypothetical protein [Bartonella bacilliformis]EKS43065.1 partition protein ParA [Bartonella bacilliformis INS]EYS88595.1 hypothetical protein X472_01146 [Bartonella bacilliformis San Pedro600-02]EYS94427.1 hypothetical protein X470_01131 [Bartonella bacilliformis Peru-18]KEG15914.1 hypothetical protein H709_01030 [Bartonella bacilliformis CUSCO5]KEG19817.1 hypothetical protein H704_01056 [Bartonella bacilliformis Peru38]